MFSWYFSLIKYVLNKVKISGGKVRDKTYFYIVNINFVLSVKNATKKRKYLYLNSNLNTLNIEVF